jgi:hypothetical protein
MSLEHLKRAMQAPGFVARCFGEPCLKIRNGRLNRRQDCDCITGMTRKKFSQQPAGSLNTFGRNEIEVAPISSALLRIACLVILYKTCKKNGLGVASGEEWFARTLCERGVT